MKVYAFTFLMFLITFCAAGQTREELFGQGSTHDHNWKTSDGFTLRRVVCHDFNRMKRSGT